MASIAAILLVFFLWGPQKIPEMARMLAQARREFDNASREFQKVSAEIQNGTSPFLATSSPPSPGAAPSPAPALPHPAAKTGDQLRIGAARRLGIPTVGRTREQIQQDIIARANPPPPPGDAPAPTKADDPTP
ncbi:MAG: twin-arginine translocase TatA/TatE family subunit [Nitrososphaerota archaeon]|nr:twin-arginine translocase TatA/TatE family subunit [Nitrososphaerota archaeon]